MARNAVQFQSGLSLPVSLERYGTEAQSRDAHAFHAQAERLCL